MSNDARPTQPTVRSVNQINPTLKNIERLFYEACVKVKEGFVLKKFAFECPEYLQGTVLPVEALAFEKDILILIAKKMGVMMPHRLAIEAILVAKKPSINRTAKSNTRTGTASEPDA